MHTTDEEIDTMMQALGEYLEWEREFNREDDKNEQNTH